jgi:transcriptional regulator with XRE-family HTH domain
MNQGSFFPLRLRELRGKRNQQEMAGFLGVAKSTWSRWEKGQNEPSIPELVALCGIEGVSSDWLFGISETRKILSPEAAVTAPCQSCRDKDAVISDLASTLKSQQEAISRLAERDEKKTASSAVSSPSFGTREGEAVSA